MSHVSMNERPPQSKPRALNRWVEVSFPVPIKAVSWDTGRPWPKRDLPDRSRFRCLAAPRLGSRNLIATAFPVAGSRTPIHS
jgi:hypothetical protein